MVKASTLAFVALTVLLALWCLFLLPGGGDPVPPRSLAEEEEEAREGPYVRGASSLHAHPSSASGGGAEGKTVRNVEAALPSSSSSTPPQILYLGGVSMSASDNAKGRLAEFTVVDAFSSSSSGGGGVAGKGSSSGATVVVDSWVFDLLPTKTKRSVGDAEGNANSEWRVVLSNPLASDDAWRSLYASQSTEPGIDSAVTTPLPPQCQRYLDEADAITVTTEEEEGAGGGLKNGVSRTVGGGGGRWLFADDGRGGLSLHGGRGVSSSPSAKGGRAATEEWGNGARSSHSVRAFARAVGPEHFEGVVSMLAPLQRLTPTPSHQKRRGHRRGPADGSDAAGEMNEGEKRGGAVDAATVLTPLSFVFDRRTCTYWSREYVRIPLPHSSTGLLNSRAQGGEGGSSSSSSVDLSQASFGGDGAAAPPPIGFASFVAVTHLYTAYGGLREDAEQTHFSHRPLRRLPWSGRVALVSPDTTFGVPLGGGGEGRGGGLGGGKGARPFVGAVVPRYNAAQEVWRIELRALRIHVSSEKKEEMKVVDSSTSSSLAVSLPLRSAHAALAVPFSCTAASLPSALALPPAFPRWLAARRDPTNAPRHRYAQTIRHNSLTLPHPAGGYAQSPYYRDYYLTYKHLGKAQHRAAEVRWERVNANANGDTPPHDHSLQLRPVGGESALSFFAAASGEGGSSSQASGGGGRGIDYGGFAALSTMDLLGRLDFGAEYVLLPGGPLGDTYNRVDEEGMGSPPSLLLPHSGLSSAGGDYASPNAAPSAPISLAAVDTAVAMGCRRPLGDGGLLGPPRDLSVFGAASEGQKEEAGLLTASSDDEETVNAAAYPSPAECLYGNGGEGNGGGGERARRQTPPSRPPLRNKVIYFIGDSHMRVLFYGFLSRMGIAYPLNKVWRGDRSDTVPAPHNVTVHYIASYFLNLTRPAALDMLEQSQNGGSNGDVVIVANVGQHHSAHCWPLRKHSAFVREAMLTLLYGTVEGGKGADGRYVTLPPGVAEAHRLPLEPFQPPLRSNSRNQPLSGRGGGGGGVVGERPNWPRPLRSVVWFGVPAQPINRHLYTPKPVGQSRKDCRTNQRHLLMSAEQRRVWEEVLQPWGAGGKSEGAEDDAKKEEGVAAAVVGGRGALLYFLDAFAASYGMAHTSLDGAHYFGWVRAEWIDALVRALRR